MSLDAKLNSIPKDQIVREVGVILDGASVSISWYGERLVSVKGFTGTIDINQLIQKYLAASPRRDDGCDNLKKRLEFYNLWSRVKNFCKDNNGLNDTWVYKYLVPVGEFSRQMMYGPMPMEYIVTPLKGTKFPSKNEWCFSFHPEDFKKLWPNEKPYSELFDFSGVTCIATKQMVEEADRRF